jgi:hypothetical protein
VVKSVRRECVRLSMCSPSGKLVQLEYALQAVTAGAPSVGIKAKNGVVLAVEKKQKSLLYDISTITKVLRLKIRVYTSLGMCPVHTTFRHLNGCSGVRICFGVGGLRIGNQVVNHNLGGSGGMLPQENLDFHISLDRFWCILSTWFTNTMIFFGHSFLPFCWGKFNCDRL